MPTHDGARPLQPEAQQQPLPAAATHKIWLCSPAMRLLVERHLFLLLEGARLLRRHYCTLPTLRGQLAVVGRSPLSPRVARSPASTATRARWAAGSRKHEVCAPSVVLGTSIRRSKNRHRHQQHTLLAPATSTARQERPLVYGTPRCSTAVPPVRYLASSLFPLYFTIAHSSLFPPGSALTRATRNV